MSVALDDGVPVSLDEDVSVTLEDGVSDWLPVTLGDVECVSLSEELWLAVALDEGVPV